MRAIIGLARRVPGERGSLSLVEMSLLLLLISLVVVIGAFRFGGTAVEVQKVDEQLLNTYQVLDLETN